MKEFVGVTLTHGFITSFSVMVGDTLQAVIFLFEGEIQLVFYNLHQPILVP